MAVKKNMAIHVFTHIKSTYLDGLVCSNTLTEISILRPIVSNLYTIRAFSACVFVDFDAVSITIDGGCDG